MYVDADIFYAKIKSGDRHSEIADKVLSQKKLYTSIITILELEIVVKREISDELSKQINELFKTKFPKVKITKFDSPVYSKSQELRRKFDLGIFDSIHAATAILGDKKIASTDNAYDRVNDLKRVT